MLRNLLKKRQEGFTLIEIVLVLAIAGLILVIVFLAVTGAQRSQRDTARKDYVNRVAAGVLNQYSNHDSSWDCSAAANVTILNAINQPTLGSVVDSVQGTALTAGDTSHISAIGSATACTVTTNLENGGFYKRDVTP